MNSPDPGWDKNWILRYIFWAVSCLFFFKYDKCVHKTFKKLSQKLFYGSKNSEFDADFKSVKMLQKRSQKKVRGLRT